MPIRCCFCCGSTHGFNLTARQQELPEDLLHEHHRLIGYDKDSAIVRGFAQFGLTVTREQFALRTDDQLAYGRLIAAGAGIGFAADYNLRHWRGVVPLLPMLKIAPLPCWLAVHREIRGSAVVRRVFDFLAEAIPLTIVAWTTRGRWLARDTSRRRGAPGRAPASRPPRVPGRAHP